MASPKKEFSLLPKIMNGGIAGIIGVTCVFPLDLVKTRLQNQTIGPNGEKMYKSILDCMKKTFKAEGYFGMYRGSGVNLLLITPEKAIKLTANDFFRYHLRKANGDLPTIRQVIAGASAGFCQVIVTTPMELIKIQMQVSGKATSSSQAKLSATSLTLSLLRTHGIKGLYKGIGATMARDVSFSAVYFPLFATLNSLGPKKADGSGEAVFWCSFLSGCASGCLSAIAVTPLDVIKTRLQASDESQRVHKGIVDTAVKIMKHEGPLALFKGGACRAMVMAPLFGIAQMVYYMGVAEYLLSIGKK